MKNKVIKLNEYRISTYSLMKRSVNSGIFSSNLSSIGKTFSNEKTENNISYESLVAFIIEYGVKFHENQSEEFSKYMSEYHKTIKFYGIKYYLPCNNKFNSKQQNIFDYLIENYI